MATYNKDFRVKHGLVVEANTHINQDLQVDGSITVGTSEISETTLSGGLLSVQSFVPEDPNFFTGSFGVYGSGVLNVDNLSPTYYNYFASLPVGTVLTIDESISATVMGAFNSTGADSGFISTLGSGYIPALSSVSWSSSSPALNIDVPVVATNFVTQSGLDLPSTINLVFDQANSGITLAQAAFDQANTGGGGSANVGLYINNDIFTANGLTDSFTLSVTPINEESTIINFDGVVQQKSEYSLSGDTIVFSSTPSDGTIIEVSSFVNAGNQIFILADAAIGNSAYQVAVNNGFVGTESEWLSSLVGPVGADGATGADGLNGMDGMNGLSAYEIALNNGFVGTEQDWLASLQGSDGSDGSDGYAGVDGDSAYQVAVNNGFVGTEQDWLASLVGPSGSDGSDGMDGAPGADGGFTTDSDAQVNSLGVGTTASTVAGEIRASNNITAYYSSDRTLKENIQDVTNPLEIVCVIGSKTFDWTDSYLEAHGGEDDYFLRKSDFGVIAQDVQSVFPQAVRTRQDGTLAVDYEKLAVLSFGAIKELVKRIEALESK